MSPGNQELKGRRTPGRKRSQLTPGRKRGAAGDFRPRRCCVMTESNEICSDSEDLFGDYGGVLEDGSLLAGLDAAEQSERGRHLTQQAGHAPEQHGGRGHEAGEAAAQHDLRPDQLTSSQQLLSDSILEALDGEEQLPSSQQQFEEQIHERAKRRKLGGGGGGGGGGSGGASTPSREAAVGGGVVKTRRSVTDQLKRTMLCNASAAAAVSRSLARKEAAVCEEVGVATRTVQSVSTHSADRGPFFGLPSKVKQLIYRLRGIQSLYAWQEECLNLECVQQRRNLIYSLPTSGGKTLVAELLLLKELLCRRKDGLFLLPYVSLVQEKVRGLASLGLELDFLVEEYAGSKGRFPPVRHRHRRSLYVATVEKGHSLVNALLEAGRLHELGLLVVDELHMLGDGSRGAVLEMTLAKVLHMSKATQIVGMSATLGNIADLKDFLKADNFTKDFRPVQLKEFVKLKDSIYEVDRHQEDCFTFSRRLTVQYTGAMQRVDPDHLIALVTEVIPAHSCLLFCPTKKNCENVVAMICSYLTQDFVCHRTEEKAVLLRELKASGGGDMCPVLRRTLTFGLGYHHSGLTGEERRLLEEAYASGVLCLLACTSTLAAGVNLPARRVILRSPYVAADFLRRSQYQQMVGRAGRAGIDTQGESILILQERDRHMAEALVCAPPERCCSQLLQEDGKGLPSLILSLVGLQITRSVAQLKEFLRGTLLYVQQGELCADASLWDVLQRSISLLEVKGLISVAADGEALQVTRLGKATFKGAVDVTHGEQLYRELSRGLEALLLSSPLHLLYLVTPYELLAHCQPDWMVYLRQFTLLSASEQKMAAAIGVPESLVARKAAGQTVKKSANMQAVKRMFLAMVLLNLLRDTSLWSSAHKFQLSRGFIQNLLSSASAFCCCVLHFTQELEELWPFHSLLAELTRKLSYCVRAELVPLMEVTGVMEARAKQLYAAGYKSLAHLANADADHLCRSIQHLHRKQAELMVASARMLVNEKAAALQEEVDDLLATPPDLPVQSQS